MITRRAFDTPKTQAGLRPVCLATPVRYVMKQDILYVVLTRARTKTIVLTLGSTLPSLTYPLAVLSAGS